MFVTYTQHCHVRRHTTYLSQNTCWNAKHCLWDFVMRCLRTMILRVMPIMCLRMIIWRDWFASMCSKKMIIPCRWMFYNKKSAMMNVERVFANEWRNTIWYEKVFLKLTQITGQPIPYSSTTHITLQTLFKHPELLELNCISYLQNIPIDYILQNTTFRNNLYYASGHPELRIEHILAYPLLRWNWIDLSKNLNIPFSDIAKTANNKNMRWDWKEISKRRDLQINFIVKNPHLGWDWFEVCGNPHVPIKDILANYGVFGCIPFHPYIDHDLAKRPDVTFDVITNNPHIIWDWSIVGRNKNITMEHIENSLQAGRQYMYFVPAFIKQNIGVPCVLWDFHAISHNPNLTIDFVLKHRKEKWNWNAVINNLHIKLADIEKHENMLLLLHKNIIQSRRNKETGKTAHYNNCHVDVLLQHALYGHEWHALSHHPNLTMKHILNNIHGKWDWSHVFVRFKLRIDDVLLLCGNQIHKHLSKDSLFYFRLNNFEIDMQDFVEQKTKWLLIASMYDCLQLYAITDGNRFALLEHILFNPVIAKMVAMC